MDGLRIHAVKITPVAFRDPALLNAVGVHEPYALRAIVEVDTGEGLVGLGETYADEGHLRRLRAAADAVVGMDVYALGAMHRKVAEVLSGDSRWETSLQTVVEKPLPGVDRAFVIAGSDQRGTIFGTYDVSRGIGVSPWYWWDDVTPVHRDGLYVLPGRHTQGTPAVVPAQARAAQPQDHSRPGQGPRQGRVGDQLRRPGHPVQPHRLPRAGARHRGMAAARGRRRTDPPQAPRLRPGRLVRAGGLRGAGHRQPVRPA
jgi:hypothetical protein